MKKGTLLYIPKPCHEDWQQMTPEGKGRFCQSCAKQVVDFTLMSDRQILDQISQAAGGVCGRFAGDQLQRPLLPVKPEKKKVWWAAALLPLAMLVEKAGAQKKHVGKDKRVLVLKDQRDMVMGMIGAPRTITPEVIRNELWQAKLIKGKIANTAGFPVPYASIYVNGKYRGDHADSLGNFRVKISSITDSIDIEASAIGYENASIHVSYSADSDITLVLKDAIVKLPEVFVSTPLTGFLGAVSYGRAITYREKTDTLIREIFHTEQFSIYPSPAPRGSNINVDVRKPGIYAMQLFDNNGRLLHVQEFDAAEGATKTSFTVPSSAAGGVYYLRLVNSKTGKQYTNKLTVL